MNKSGTIRMNHHKIIKGMIRSGIALCFVAVSINSSAQQLMEYDLKHPVTINLPKEVDQISGLTYYKPDHAVFAIDDDEGNIYKITLSNKPVIKKWAFDKASDYEDIALAGNEFYILNSDGSITWFPFAFPVEKAKKSQLDINGKNEFESLFYDPHLNQLLLLCKDCESDNKKENSVWAFSLKEKSFLKKPAFKVTKKSIEAALGQDIDQFKPSAAAIHPVNGALFIVSSINKLLVVMNRQREVEHVYPLDPELFKQPEGITFTAEGDMLISNESAKSGPATILLFKRR